MLNLKLVFAPDEYARQKAYEAGLEYSVGGFK